MNKDKKLAIILAPFLLVGGYIVSDLYIESKQNQTKLFALSNPGECEMFSGDCILQSGDMKINITDERGTTKANTSYPVDSVAISLVYSDGREIIYGLEKTVNPQYWEKETDIRTAITQSKTATILRIVVTQKGSTYFSEFSPVTAPG
jgi:hypothetical protein